ncbi:Response regulator inhibitor for tor operon [Serratia quinivorans]|uniref:helix-turn-helix transcriptional regulator n=1 Tax=Serratia quinivorans TaxID=137545 RepID=UPI00217BCD76|nr:AlpA family phage regulatory protein [Serratia quinivorans]CAI1816322.1 Response regulator inhibitor for tor operon [Serratia quinivorans]
MTDTTTISPDALISMKFITKDTGMTEQWFYRLIKRGEFPKQIKLGRMSRWKYADYTEWKSNLSIKQQKAA